MLYRALVGSVERGVARLAFAFVEVPDDLAEQPGAPEAHLLRRVAQEWGLSPVNVVTAEMLDEAALHERGLGPAELPAWRWFEHGQVGAGALARPLYISADSALFLIDSEVTVGWLRRAHRAALAWASGVERDLSRVDAHLAHRRAA